MCIFLSNRYYLARNRVALEVDDQMFAVGQVCEKCQEKRMMFPGSSCIWKKPTIKSTEMRCGRCCGYM